MDESFNKHIQNLDLNFEKLMSMTPVTAATLPKQMPSQGVYLFSEGNNHLYVGRGDKLKVRLLKIIHARVQSIIRHLLPQSLHGRKLGSKQLINPV